MKKLLSFIYPIIPILIPFFLIMSSVRIILNPLFLDYEYHLENLPADEFGFSIEDRLNWGKISWSYLTNRESIEFLANLEFNDGSPIYNQRELSHMLDVKILIQLMLKIWYVVTAILILTGLASWRIGMMAAFWRTISRGGWLTIGLILLILFGIVINFDAFFRGFHAIFFTGDTWLFFATDTLIRLFPEKVFSDAFTFGGILTISGAVIFAFLGAYLARHTKQEPAV